MTIKMNANGLKFKTVEILSADEEMTYTKKTLSELAKYLKQ